MKRVVVKVDLINGPPGREWLWLVEVRGKVTDTDIEARFRVGAALRRIFK